MLEQLKSRRPLIPQCSLSVLRTCGLQYTPGNIILWKNRKARWIRLLKTETPHGLSLRILLLSHHPLLPLQSSTRPTSILLRVFSDLYA